MTQLLGVVRPGRTKDRVGAASLPGEVQSALAGTPGAGLARPWEARLLVAVVGGDLLALLGGVLAGLIMRPDYPLLAGLLLVPIWLLALLLHSAYNAQHLAAGATERRRVADASLRLGLAVLLVSYLFTATRASAWAEPGRDLVLITLPIGALLLVTCRLAVRAGVVRLRHRGHCRQRVLVVGTVLDVVHLAEHARRTPSAGFVVSGACLPSYGGSDRRRPAERRASRAEALDRQQRGDRRAESDRRADIEELAALGIPVLGAPHDVLEAVRRLGADTVAVAGHGVLSRHALRRLSWQLEGTRVRLLVASVLTEVASPRITLRPLGGLPLLQIEAPAFGGARRWLKGVLDRALAALIVAMLAPVLAGLAIAIRLDSPGPVLFRQQRVGRGGEPFACLKLRTMRVGADREVARLAEQNEGDGVLFKMRVDPRVTRVGRVLRRLSVDELPQLFNVLGGSMSLVGPRPPLPSEVAEYGDDVRRRLLVKPGMTGLWQVSGRSDLSWAESVRLDLYYVENWSPLLDLSLMARTVTAVLQGRGAY